MSLISEAQVLKANYCINDNDYNDVGLTNHPINKMHAQAIQMFHIISYIEYFL